SECRNLLAACSSCFPILVPIKNGIEIFQDTGFHVPTTGQAASVPVDTVFAGQPLEFLQSFSELNNNQSGFSGLPSGGPTLKATAGARSVHLTMPLGDQELGLRLLGLPRIIHSNACLDQSFHDDAWPFVRTLAYAADAANEFHDQWRVQVLVIP